LQASSIDYIIQLAITHLPTSAELYVKSWSYMGRHLSGVATPEPSPLPSKPRPLWAIWD